MSAAPAGRVLHRLRRSIAQFLVTVRLDASQDALAKVAPAAFVGLVASVSVGIYRGRCVLDLDYAEDSRAETDMNVVMMDGRGFIEVHGTAENGAFVREQLDELLGLAEGGIDALFEAQRQALAE